jgi:hypothetical protein
MSAGAGLHPPASPLLAHTWLESWRAIGGGITITGRGRVEPWRWIEGADSDADLATELMADFDQTEGMGPAVRAVMRAQELLKAKRK